MEIFLEKSSVELGYLAGGIFRRTFGGISDANLEEIFKGICRGLLGRILGEILKGDLGET